MTYERCRRCRWFWESLIYGIACHIRGAYKNVKGNRKCHSYERKSKPKKESK